MASEPSEHPEAKGELMTQARELLRTCVDTWQANWRPGEYITVDESMCRWSGKGEMHITILPRKPTGKGFKIDTTACSAANIIIEAELDEGKEAMKTAEYRNVTATHTAVTLRLTKAYAHTDRVVIGDSRFGSCNTAEFLADVHGLDSILAVKTASAGFPKRRLRAALGGVRGRRASFKVDVELDKGVVPFFASGVHDKKPMYVVATCGTTLVTEVA